MKNFNDVKACYTIRDAWHDLNLAGEPKKSCRCPWREDRNPSFSIHNEGRRFKDFSTDESGDVADFVASATGWSVKDSLAWCRERACINFESGFSPIPKRQEPRRELVIPPSDPGENSDWLAVAKLRGIHPYAVEVASKLGILVFGKVCGYPSWILNEPGKIAEARRMDGEVFPPMGTLGKRKAHTLAGSRKDWPLGTKMIENPAADIFLVEGGPDWLAAIHFLVVRKRKGLIPVAMMGRANRISPEALAFFEGRRVRIYPHDDPDEGGLEAARRWAGQLREVGSKVDAFTFDGLIREDGKPVNDLNDAVLIHHEDKLKLEGLLP